MVLPEKLKEARKLIGVSQSEAANRAQIEQKDISLLESGKKKFIPDEYILFLYNSGIDLNSLWNPNENVRHLKAATPVIDIDEIYDTDSTTVVTPTVKKVNTTSKTTDNTTGNYQKTLLYPQFITVDKQGNENILYVPIKAAAGYLNGHADREFIETLPTFSMPGLTDATYRMFEVDGDSMNPTLLNKQRVIGRWVEKLEYIREDHVHIVVTKNRGVVIKRLLNRIDKYGYIVAKSDALDDRNLYPNFEIYPDEVLEIWFGVMHMSNTFKHPSDMYKRVNNIEADLTEVLRVLKQNNLLNTP